MKQFAFAKQVHAQGRLAHQSSAAQHPEEGATPVCRGCCMGKSDGKSVGASDVGVVVGEPLAKVEGREGAGVGDEVTAYASRCIAVPMLSEMVTMRRAGQVLQRQSL